MNKRIDWSQLLTLLGMFIFAVLMWDWSFMYPIKAFVVLLHELGHGLAAVLTGGEIMRIELSSQLGGVCWSRGGWRFAVLPAGYLGSMILGGGILIGAARTRFDKQIAMGLGVTVIAVTLLFVRSMFGFGFGLLFGLALILAGRFLPEVMADLMLKFLGLTSAMYAVIDIKEDLISRTVPGSDAWAMSQELFLPSVFWGVLWMAVALAFGVVLLYIASVKDEASGAKT